MTIYIDVVLFENIAMNYIILLATGLIENKRISVLKIFLSSSIGGIYSILNYVLNMSNFINIFLKIFISIIMIKIAFNSYNYKTFIKQLIWFYLISFMMGGIAFMLLFSIKHKNIVFQNGHLVGFYPIKMALFGGIIGFTIITIISNIQKKKVENQICDIEIFYNGKQTTIKSFIDTGNLLKEPISNQDVIVVEKNSLTNLLDSIFLDDLENVMKGKNISNGMDFMKNKVKLIPFSTLGNENGLLVGFKPDYIKIYSDEIKIAQNVVIGIYDGKLTKTNLYTSLIGLNILKEGDISDRFIANA